MKVNTPLNKKNSNISEFVIKGIMITMHISTHNQFVKEGINLSLFVEGMTCSFENSRKSTGNYHNYQESFVRSG